ncbi:UNVERIFIED_CONTAM: 2-oxoglutarate-dependent dioxygenase imqE [Sesamum latifolium]|uniref:2-oxoglutarate-dependent dioxygenase imqE n=1 Tax=Sesamum latifolium TaxID=2727402 RepID=A0AAW2WWB5_9LAMI
MAKTLELPIIDFASSDRNSTAKSIRQACIDCGFFYLVNHGVEDKLLQKVLEGIGVALVGRLLGTMVPFVHRFDVTVSGVLDLLADFSPLTKIAGDSKESFYIGPLEDIGHLNQWPSEEVLPSWRSTMEDYYKRVLNAGERLISLIALALNLDENFFNDVGAFNLPNAFLRLLHYPGELGSCSEEIYGASAHSDYGMITLLATDGIGGLQERLLTWSFRLMFLPFDDPTKVQCIN